MGALIKRICVQYAKDHKMSEEEAEATLREMLASSDKKGHGTTVRMIGNMSSQVNLCAAFGSATQSPDSVGD